MWRSRTTYQDDETSDARCNGCEPQISLTLHPGLAHFEDVEEKVSNLQGEAYGQLQAEQKLAHFHILEENIEVDWPIGVNVIDLLGRRGLSEQGSGLGE